MAANDLHTKNDSNLNITPLNGQENFIRWWREFLTLVRAKGYWSLFTGEEQLLPKPERNNYFTSAKGRSQMDSQESTKIVASIEEYRLDVDLYEKQMNRAQLAIELLLAQIEPALCGLLTEIANPKGLLDSIKSQHRKKGRLALLEAYGAMAEVKLSDHESMGAYYQELCLCAEDIRELKGSISDDQFEYHLINGLTDDYDEFVRFFKQQLSSPPTPPAASSDTIKALFKQLLVQEASFKMKKPVPNQRSITGL